MNTKPEQQGKMDKIVLNIVEGTTGIKAAYINDYRITTSKPWGLQTILFSIEINPKHLLQALKDAEVISVQQSKDN